MVDDSYIRRLKKIYSKLLKEHGSYSTNSVAWNDVKAQFTRFSVLSKVGKLESRSLLDVGSGLGDLYSYLQGFNVDYTGIELSTKLYQASLAKYPDIHIINADFLNYQFNQKFDWVVSSGTFNAKVSNDSKVQYNYLYSAIQKMFELSVHGISFNLLTNPNLNKNIVFDKSFQIYLSIVDPKRIVEFCKTLSSRVTILTDYLPDDFTIYMYKKY